MSAGEHACSYFPSGSLPSYGPSQNTRAPCKCRSRRLSQRLSCISWGTSAHCNRFTGNLLVGSHQARAASYPAQTPIQPTQFVFLYPDNQPTNLGPLAETKRSCFLHPHYFRAVITVSLDRVDTRIKVLPFLARQICTASWGSFLGDMLRNSSKLSRQRPSTNMLNFLIRRLVL